MAQAYSYIRWSSEKQTAGDSKRRQSTGADEYCQKHGLTLSSDRYLDAGVSAFRGKNAAEGALAGFLEAVDQGRVPKGSMLLIENFDRLSRSPVMTACRRRSNIDPPCRSNTDPGMDAGRARANCG